MSEICIGTFILNFYCLVRGKNGFHLKYCCTKNLSAIKSNLLMLPWNAISDGWRTVVQHMGSIGWGLVSISRRGLVRTEHLMLLISCVPHRFCWITAPLYLVLLFEKSEAISKLLKWVAENELERNSFSKIWVLSQWWCRCLLQPNRIFNELFPPTIICSIQKPSDEMCFLWNCLFDPSPKFGQINFLKIGWNIFQRGSSGRLVFPSERVVLLHSNPQYSIHQMALAYLRVKSKKRNGVRKKK